MKKRLFAFGLLLLPVISEAICRGNEAYGTYCRLFHRSSPWNAVPINPVLGSTFVIPTSTYYPTISPGAYSTGVFLAKSTDPTVTVYGDTASGVWNPDAESYQPNITIPRWPAETTAATGTDGHCDIADPLTGIVHSFWRLKKDAAGKWTAQQYAWTPLNGRGFAEPAHYFQGARAAGVPTSGGIIRAHEINDGKSMYYHALAMSLTYNALKKDPKYIFPATSGDSDTTTNTGQIPEGARLMLPDSFNVDSLKTEELKKVARTLKVFGALVVDRNVGTPFAIYVETGTGYTLHPGGWNSVAAAELQLIRASLRMMTSASSWRGGGADSASSELYKGAPVSYAIYESPERTTLAMNYLSMRRVGKPGFGSLEAGTSDTRGVFDTWLQGLIFPASLNKVQQSYSSQTLSGVSWATMIPGAKYTLSVKATGGAYLGMTIGDLSTGTCLPAVSSGPLQNGQTYVIIWPAKACNIRVLAVKPQMTVPTVATIAPTLVRTF